MQIESWIVRQPAAPMTREARDEVVGPGDALVAVAGCGVCHTDLAFFYDNVPTRHGLPLTLGHEISGTVVEAGPGAEAWIGRSVIVPAVLPCGECDACRAGRGQVCPNQIFPGSDVHGGFGTHVRVPARGLCPVPDLRSPVANPRGLDLAALSVIADAVSTPYQAVVRSGLAAGDLAVFVGVGGIGGFGVQVAAARGATTVAVDVDEAKLARQRDYGAAYTIDASALAPKALRSRVREIAAAHRVPTWRTRIFETSGTVNGQSTAFGLLGHGSHLSIVGYTPAPVEIKLSNLMAFDATVQGNWGCLPEHYPAIVDLVLAGTISIEPFIEPRPLSTINDVFAELHAAPAMRRYVLIP